MYSRPPTSKPTDALFFYSFFLFYQDQFDLRCRVDSDSHQGTEGQTRQTSFSGEEDTIERSRMPHGGEHLREGRSRDLDNTFPTDEKTRLTYFLFVNFKRRDRYFAWPLHYFKYAMEFRKLKFFNSSKNAPTIILAINSLILIL